MADYWKYTAGNLTNVTALTLEKGEDDYPRMKTLERVGERFLHSAILLPEGEFLGIQLSVTGGTEMECTAFSGPGTRVSKEDFNWIFREFGKAKETAPADMRELFGEDRTVYRLTSVVGGPRDTDAMVGRDRYEYYEGNAEDVTASCYFGDMFNMLKAEDAVVQITAGSVPAGKVQHGMILISFPNRISLRMRTLISLAFPHFAVEEIGSPQDCGDDLEFLSDSRLLDGMTRFLGTLVSQGVKKSGKKRSDSQYDDGFEDDFLGVGNDDLALCEDDDDAGSGGNPKGSADGSDADGKNPKSGSGGSVADGKNPKDGGNTEGNKPDGGANATASGGDTGKPTSLRALNLTIRSLSALRREGINSVEKLEAMSDEELRRARSISTACVEEIREKLAKNRGKEKPAPLPKTCSEQLGELIGLAEVKKQVERIAAFARMKKTMEQEGKRGLSVALNMEFVGNPGTAKTTVARLVAGIFYENGLLASREMIEVGRPDLVARYTGQTADQVKKVFRQAKGKLLFIDEAYSLVDVWENSYGDEAINTIVQEMENNRENTIVIFAGYPDKMDEFFNRNHGLRSRVPFRVTFPDYSAEEMVRIAENEVVKRGFSVTAPARERVLELCRAEKGKPDSGNGRFCRNLVENAILEYAARVFAPGMEEPNPDYILRKEDFPELQKQKPEEKPEKAEEKRRIIGFVA